MFIYTYSNRIFYPWVNCHRCLYIKSKTKFFRIYKSQNQNFCLCSNSLENFLPLVKLARKKNAHGQTREKNLGLWLIFPSEIFASSKKSEVKKMPLVNFTLKIFAYVNFWLRKKCLCILGYLKNLNIILTLNNILINCLKVRLLNFFTLFVNFWLRKKNLWKYNN